MHDDDISAGAGKSHTGGQDKAEGGKIQAILRHPRDFAIHFVREFGHFWELYPTRVRMNRSAYRENLHEKDARIVRKTVFGTGWTSLISIVSVGPMFFFALIGTGAMWLQKARRRELALLCVMVLSFAIGYSCFYAKTRYRMPIEPYIMMLGAYGLWHTWTVLAMGSPWKSFASLVLAPSRERERRTK